MKVRFLTVACVAGSMTVLGLAPTSSHAQSAGAVLGGLAGGVLGGVIAGSIAAQAQAVRQRPVVVYAPTRTVRTVRVVREVRHAPPRRVARAQQRPMQPAAGPTGAQVVNVSADPFASTSGGGTTAVNRTR